MPDILTVTSPYDRHFIREFPLADDKEIEKTLAVATGCPAIVKPASTTPVSCFNLVRLLKGCGLPDGWCTALVCRRELAEKLAADPRIGYMTFIGSHEVGWKLKNLLAPGTRFALEHGGVAPVIVDGTAGIDEIVPLIAKGGFYHAGQVCVSVQKVFVHRSKARELAGKLAEEADKLIVGDPLDPATDIGPMIAESEAQRVQEWVEEAISSGAELVQSSKFKVQSSKCKSKIKSSNRPIVQSSNRQIVQSPNRQIVQSPNRPIVLFAPPDSAKVSREEVFGPVICVYPFDDLGDAVARANSLRYAFQAAVFTQNINTALEAAQRLNASAVMINDHTAFRVDWMPFGGRDESGIGTGGIPYTMREMTREKLIVFKS